jgi:hypothetical protein
MMTLLSFVIEVLNGFCYFDTYYPLHYCITKIHSPELFSLIVLCLLHDESLTCFNSLLLPQKLIFFSLMEPGVAEHGQNCVRFFWIHDARYGLIKTWKI